MQPKFSANRTLILSIALTSLPFLSACGGSSSPSSNNNIDTTPISTPTAPTTPSSALSAASDAREWLKVEHLIADQYPHQSPIHNSHFMPVGETGQALEPFSGTLTVNNGRIIGNYSEFTIPGDASFKNFPQVDLSFVSDNGYLIPVNRERQITSNDGSFWGIILDPGEVWSEPNDEGWSRASFPFTLISARRNQGHNGIATFLYKSNEVSHLRMQVVQETAPWFINDMYSQLSINYEPKDFTNTQTLIEQFELERTNAVTIKPWEELTTLNSIAQFNGNLSSTSINQTGLIKDGVVYLQPCYTRYGDYPYCRWMRNGAYSVTKSLGAAITMFRLAELYGDQVFDLKVTDYLTDTSNHNGWQNVTFGDLLNMASGIGNNGTVQGSGTIFADENTALMESWLVMSTEAFKLRTSFNYGNYDWGPGEEFRYNSVMTFILSAAIDNYYKSIEGQNADFWQMMKTDVYNVIGIQHMPTLVTDEADGATGIPELFHGLYPNVDDLAKISALLQNDGYHNGQQLLHSTKLREALFKTQEQGLRSWWEDNQYGKSRYLHSFWTTPYSNDICIQQIPYMSGYGGVIFAIMPNGLSAFRFADAQSYSPLSMIQASNLERDMCE